MQTAKYYMNTQHGVTTHWRTELSLQAAVGCVRTLHSFQSVADFTDLPVASRCPEFQSDFVDIAAFVFFFFQSSCTQAPFHMFRGNRQHHVKFDVC